ncbi:protein FAM200C-like [Centruroides vittatus]|uniref:protein FAM200C-like n=1 Tax=Centruroides vittatus TaxID=120091 RepID=UPI00350F54DF
MSSNITNQQVTNLKLVSALSRAVDESCDINDTAQVSLFVRFISSTGPKEELLGLLPLKGQAREDLANAVIECIEKHHIPLDKIVSISTYGAKTKALNHCQFKEFLVEMGSEYTDLLLHNKVHWLSRGNILKHFASLLTEIKAFLLEKGVYYPN